jgi:hypothetical protein
MTIPRQVSETADLAEQLHSRMFAEAPSEEVVEQEQEEQPSYDENTEEANVPHDDDVQELRKFKERYLHLQGKYDAEVPRLHKELKEFKQNVFERLEAKIEQPVEAPKEDKFAKFREEYGDELYMAIRELAALETEEKLKATLKPVQDQVANVEDTQVKAAQQNFVSYLDSKVSGDWQSLWAGKDPKFIEFLNQPDPSGLYTYGQLVQAYNDQWDADRMSIVFNTYLDSSQKQVQRQPRPEKNAMVAPSRQNVHSTPSLDNARIWTGETMKQFQEADRLGKYTPEESKAMWDDLLSAPAQNRMR